MRDRALDVAITGVHARLPGPTDPGAWWAAVRTGTVLTTRFDADALAEAGVPAHLVRDPSYVPVRGRVADGERFDAELFGVSPREAELIDPQHRMMLEATWAALEDAGRDPLTDTLRTAVFASASESSLARLLAGDDLDPETREALEAGVSRDFMATRIAYRLGLRGPAMSVSTACSSSLVAVHLAAQSLNSGDCDQAVVVAASARFPQAGSVYARGGIVSPDGVCRPFDAGANGTIGGSGVVAMVLRRFGEAPADAAPHGVILGSAVNNDGPDKAGYSAPSPRGQAAVLRAALRAAAVEAGSLGYLEAHGTGTYVGDPIEWSATSGVLREAGVRPAQIAVGSVKANIGHLDAAAGLAGLHRTLMVLRHGEVPAMAGFSQLNPLLPADGSPLRVPEAPGGWEGPEPRRAGVSSFGIGGTNAHVIVEAPPPPVGDAPPPPRRSPVIITLSAVRPAALDSAAGRLAEALADGSVDARDAAFSLRVGRAVLPERLAVAAATGEEAAAALRGGPRRARGRAPAGGDRPVVFLLPGQGAQRPGMAAPLAARLQGFGKLLEDVLDAFPEDRAARVREALYDTAFPAAELRGTLLAQPALFAVGFAAAGALAEAGVRPIALAGHSLGEITAATLAGVLDPAAAAGLVALRAEVMSRCPPGAMLAVTGEVAEAGRWTSADPRLELAAVNSPDGYVLSGPEAAVEELRRRLEGTVPVRVLRTGHAFHSAAMEPAAEALRAHLADRAPGRVRVPFVTNVDGAVVEAGARVPLTVFAEAARHTVRFGDGLRALRERYPDAVALEVGPGGALSAAATRVGVDAVRLLPGTGAHEPLPALAQLWTTGVPVDRAAFAPAGSRIRLPGTVFGGGHFPVSAVRLRASGAGTPAAPAARTVPPGPTESAGSAEPADPATEERPAAWEELLAAWRDVLGHPAVEPDDDFYALGGDSLTAIRVVRRLEGRLGIDLPLREFMLARTLGQQARLLARLAADRELEDQPLTSRRKEPR
ncbi:acyltransferase domain-containing protein [Streptomyces sp. AJS327]|uniref:type I polyketide synthase n=1 Tax=Streptomyces sp. AJS327 TaxID=2545265 RepID=UPI0015DEEB2B|nr:type I polyketide synthase [Streptomyces sp. AJS327]MBA0051201.1 acyltransferase domain-containing protein [Streptomyces sp. AJS327]